MPIGGVGDDGRTRRARRSRPPAVEQDDWDGQSVMVRVDGRP